MTVLPLDALEKSCQRPAWPALAWAQHVASELLLYDMLPMVPDPLHPDAVLLHALPAPLYLQYMLLGCSFAHHARSMHLLT